MRLIGTIARGLILAMALGAAAADAQQYPNKPIKFVQGFPAGGNIAAEQVARGTPDGYTLLLTTTAHVVSPALYASLNYDPINDFAFISSVTNVPTVAETVAPKFEMITWIGTATTHGTPKPILDRLNQEFRRAIALPNVEEQLQNLGGFPRSSTPEEATERVKSEIARWKEVVQKAGIANR